MPRSRGRKSRTRPGGRSPGAHAHEFVEYDDYSILSAPHEIQALFALAAARCESCTPGCSDPSHVNDAGVSVNWL